MRRIKPAISAYAWQLCLCDGKYDLWITEGYAALWLRIPMKAASDSDGKAATDSDPKRPLFSGPIWPARFLPLGDRRLRKQAKET